MKRITVKDVASRAQVSISSVSRYINDPTSINPIPALKIGQAIKELGYIPNTYAQGLKRGNSKTIGVIVPGLGPFFSSVCTALNDFFYQQKYLLYICDTGENIDKERYYVNALLGQQVAGILIALSGRTSEFIAETSKRFPYIVMIDQFAEDCPVDSVYEESCDSSYQLTKYMIDKGHRHFILLFRTKLSTNTPHRLRGTEKALEEAGMDINEMDVHFDISTEEKLYESLRQDLSNTPIRTAVIGYSPLIMENAMIALNRLNKKVPVEIDLAGYVLNDFQSKFGIEVPCIIQNPYELGFCAGDVLLRRIRKTGNTFTPRQYCIDNELHIPTASLST